MFISEKLLDGASSFLCCKQKDTCVFSVYLGKSACEKRSFMSVGWNFITSFFVSRRMSYEQYQLVIISFAEPGDNYR